MKKFILFPAIIFLISGKCFSQNSIGNARPVIGKTITPKGHAIVPVSKSSLIPPVQQVKLTGQTAVNHAYLQAGGQTGNTGKTSSWCLSDKVTNNYIYSRLAADPAYLTSMNKMYQNVQQWISNNPNYLSQKAVKTIPVVVHVVYNASQPDENVSDALIYDMINTLNEDFRRLNPDASQTRSIFLPVAADAQIEFCMALRDPSNNATNGIVRKQTTKTWWDPDTETDDMKLNTSGGDNAWDPTKYLNIWICDIDNDQGYGTAGYAYLPTPGMHGSWRDGLVIDNDIGIYYGSRTATHEIGHYLGLKHTWGNNPPSCSDDDGFTDTPTCSDENFGCNTLQNTCTNDVPNFVDQIENYMSYADCQNMFTTMQANYMNSVLNTTRGSLLTSQACQPTAPPVTDFSANVTTVSAGQYVTFSDLTTGGPNSWSWNFGGGGTPNTSTAQNPAIQFNTVGSYTVSLTATNSLGSDAETKNSYISVVADTTSCDTIHWSYLLNAPLTYYGFDWVSPDDSGYVSGWNVYQTNAHAQKFLGSEVSPNNYVLGGIYDFVFARKGNNASKIVFTVWEDNGAGGSPGTIAGTDTMNMAFLDTVVQSGYINLMQHYFASPVLVNGTFFYGIQMLSFDNYGGPSADTLALVQTQAGNQAPGSDMPWVRYSGTWYDYGTLFGLSNCNLDISAYMTDMPPTGSFFANTTSGCAPLTVDFDASASQNFDSIYWDLDGDDLFDYVTYDPTISVEYTGTGTFSVTILAFGSCGYYAEYTRTNYITVNPAPALTTASTVTSCGSCNGTASVTASGATSPYTYLWNDPAPAQSTSTATGLCVGSYQVLVTDAKGCTSNSGVSVNTSANMAISITPSGATCGQNNGTAAVTVTGGTSPYSYSWSNSQTGSVATGLAAGTYNVTVTDNNGCSVKTDFFSAAVISDVAYVNDATASGTNLTCAGNNSGAVSVTATTGVTPYTYVWTGGCTASSCSNLAAGTYTVTVYDNNGCQSISSSSITQPVAVTASITSKTDVSCYNGTNGSATVTASGGTGAFTYTWSSGSTSSTATGLSATTYTVTVRDANSCSVTASTSITQPAQLTVTTSTTVANCGGNNGTATATPSGGTGSYSYLWSAGNQTTQTATALSAGIYNVTVSDGNGCTSTASATVTNPGAPSVTLSQTGNILCNGQSAGAATANTTGGTGSYTYSWNNAQTGSVATGLTAGTYSVTVTDASTCSGSASITVTQPAVLAVTASGNNVSCYGYNNGSVSATSTGGVSPYTYAWSSGMTSNLAPGTYSVTVADANGCMANSSVTITEPSALTVVTSKTDATCQTCNNGSATASVSGGSTPYSYAWSNGSSSSLAFALLPGTYVLTVTDANNCSGVDTVIISYPVNINSTDVSGEVNIFPNPANNIVYISFASLHDKTEISVFNFIGELVMVKGNESRFQEKIALDFSNEKSGIYLCRIQFGNSIMYEKITVLK